MKTVDRFMELVEAIAENDLSRSFVEGAMIAMPGGVVSILILAKSKNKVMGLIAATAADLAITIVTNRVIEKLEQDSLNWWCHQERMKMDSTDN